jgi:hypothetical protein
MLYIIVYDHYRVINIIVDQVNIMLSSSINVDIHWNANGCCWIVEEAGHYPKTPKPLIFHVSVVNNWLTIQINTYFIGELTI